MVYDENQRYRLRVRCHDFLQRSVSTTWAQNVFPQKRLVQQVVILCRWEFSKCRLVAPGLD